MAIHLTGMGSNLGIKIADAGDGNANLILGQSVKESRGRNTLVQSAEGVDVPRDNIDGGHVQEAGSLWYELRPANDEHVVSVGGMN